MKRTFNLLVVAAMVVGALGIAGCHRSSGDAVDDEEVAAADGPNDEPAAAAPAGLPASGSGDEQPDADTGSASDAAGWFMSQAERRFRRMMARWEERRERRADRSGRRHHRRGEHPRRGRRHGRMGERFEPGQ